MNDNDRKPSRAGRMRNRRLPRFHHRRVLRLEQCESRLLLAGPGAGVVGTEIADTSAHSGANTASTNPVAAEVASSGSAANATLIARGEGAYVFLKPRYQMSDQAQGNAVFDRVGDGSSLDLAPIGAPPTPLPNIGSSPSLAPVDATALDFDPKPVSPKVPDVFDFSLGTDRHANIRLPRPTPRMPTIESLPVDLPPTTVSIQGIVDQGDHSRQSTEFAASSGSISTTAFELDPDSDSTGQAEIVLAAQVTSLEPAQRRELAASRAGHGSLLRGEGETVRLVEQPHYAIGIAPDAMIAINVSATSIDSQENTAENKQALDAVTWVTTPIHGVESMLIFEHSRSVHEPEPSQAQRMDQAGVVELDTLPLLTQETIAPNPTESMTQPAHESDRIAVDVSPIVFSLPTIIVAAGIVISHSRFAASKNDTRSRVRTIGKVK